MLAYKLLGAALLGLGGCHTVRLDPISDVGAAALPISARVNIPEETAAFTYDVQSAAAFAGNRWRIQVGEALVKYAEAYLAPVFPQGDDVSIAISIESFDVHDFEAHIDARFTVTKESGVVVFDQKYHANGRSYFTRTVWGGAFAMKSSMQKTTHEALRSLFERFLRDVNANYPDWVGEHIQVPVESVAE